MALLSYRAFAATINVDESAVRRAIREGKFCKGVNIIAKKIDTDLAYADSWVIKASVIKPQSGVSRKKAIEKLDAVNEQPSATAKQTIADTEHTKAFKQQLEDKINTAKAEGVLIADLRVFADTPMAEAMRINELFSAEMARLKLEELEKTLVKKSEVEKVLFAFGSQLKKAIQKLPENVVDNVMAAENKVAAIHIMKVAINEILEQHANLTELTLED